MANINGKEFKSYYHKDFDRILSFLNFDKVDLQNKPIYFILLSDSQEITNMMDTMSDYSFYQVLNNLVLNAENKDSNKQFITDFNDNKDFLELKLNNYPIESIESSFIKSYIYPIIVSGLIFLFSSFFIFINGMMIRNLRKYSIYLS